MSDQSTPVPDPVHPEQRPTPPGWTPAAAAADATRTGPRRWWHQATSTGGGRAALAAVAVLAALFVVVGIGLTTALVVSHDRGGDNRGFGTSARDGMGPGNRQAWPDGMSGGMGMGRGHGEGNGRGQAPDQGDQGGQGDQGNPGPGLGMGRAAGAALGAVLHGEFTTALTGTPTVMVVQTGRVTAYTAGTSLRVKSTDDFEATYTLNASTPTTGRTTTGLATGMQVHVVAAKDGMKVTAIVVG